MTSKICLTLFVSVTLAVTTISQCIGREAVIVSRMSGAYDGAWPYDTFTPFDMGYGPGWAPTGCGAGFAGFGAAYGFEPVANYGGGLAVTSASPIAPTGLTVTSENAIEGVVAVSGQLPFLGAVATDGVFQTAGAGAVSYGCGDGAVGIVAEAPIAPAAYGYGATLGVPSIYNGYAGPIGYGSCGPLY